MKAFPDIKNDREIFNQILHNFNKTQEYEQYFWKYI